MCSPRYLDSMTKFYLKGNCRAYMHRLGDCHRAWGFYGGDGEMEYNVSL